MASGKKRKTLEARQADAPQQISKKKCTAEIEEKYGETTENFHPRITTETKFIAQFDTTHDLSDHHFANKKQSFVAGDATQKRIYKEWKILGDSLPDSIYVRVHEQRSDLMRAAIIGPQGTPYHDGLFFFDIFFPTGYPNIPPKVHYRSFGMSLNPNLYPCGKVCLSLLNTWSGSHKEKWMPNRSTVLQVLVSIQALVLNEKPYFNEPYRLIDSEELSRSYNETVFMLSCKCMVSLLQQPPASFRNLVMNHFYDRSQVILTACQAYINGFRIIGHYQIDEPFLEDRLQVSGSFKILMKRIYADLVKVFGQKNLYLTNEWFLLRLNKMVIETQNRHKVREELKRLEEEKNMPFLLKKIRAGFRVIKELVFFLME